MKKSGSRSQKAAAENPGFPALPCHHLAGKNVAQHQKQHRNHPLHTYQQHVHSVNSQSHHQEFLAFHPKPKLISPGMISSTELPVSESLSAISEADSRCLHSFLKAAMASRMRTMPLKHCAESECRHCPQRLSLLENAGKNITEVSRGSKLDLLSRSSKKTGRSLERPIFTQRLRLRSASRRLLFPRTVRFLNREAILRRDQRLDLRARYRCVGFSPSTGSFAIASLGT